MQVETPAIVCAVLAHGEAGAVVRVLTPDNGLMAGYVRGGRSRRLRPVLQIGNGVVASLRARVEEQLAAMTVEMVTSRAVLAFDPLGAVALEWLGALLAETLPEAQPFPAVYRALDPLLTRMGTADARAWTADLARFELMLLHELGLGLDLSHCAATGQTDDLAWVSPRSRTAVSRAAGLPYAARLLPLPAFLIGPGEADWLAIARALALTRHFFARDLLEGRAARVLDARDRLAALVDRRRIAG